MEPPWYTVVLLDDQAPDFIGRIVELARDLEHLLPGPALLDIGGWRLDAGLLEYGRVVIERAGAADERRRI